MGFDGYLNLGGTEIVNAQRTAAYVHNLTPGIPLVRRTDEYDTINVAIGEELYRSPVLDDAPWMSAPEEIDAFLPNPYAGFYGLYPLGITGIGDGTMRATVSEAILDGGFVNAQRDGTRSIRVRGLLIGASMASAEAGLAWLRNALRENACAMHGDQCGYTDLRYFTAKPDVCEPLYVKDYQAGEIIPFGPTNIDTSPLVYSSHMPPAPLITEWQFDGLIDGAIVRWGTMRPDSSEVIFEHESVYLRRSNFIVNPRLRGATGTATLPSWTATDATVSNGSSEDWVKVTQDDGPDFRTNWLPDPSFENGDPADQGWRSSGGLTDTVDGTAPQGTHVAVVPAAADGAYIEASMLGTTLFETTGTLSFWTAHDANLVVTITDNEGIVIDTNPIGGLTEGWQRVDVAVPLRKDYVVRVATTDVAEELRVDGFLLEEGALGTYFDGDTPDATDLVYSFVGSPAGPSRLVDTTSGDFASFSLTTPPTDAPAYDATLTFYAAAPESTGSLLVELIDIDDNVIASTTVAPTVNGTRFALSVGYGRRVRPRFSSADLGELYLGRVAIEAGTHIDTFFDGNTDGPDGYTVTWDGAPNNSISRMTLINDELFRTDITTERVFLYVDQGNPSVNLSITYPRRMTLKEQMAPYDRTYHKVKCTQAPSKIREMQFDSGAAIEIDFVLTAANPHAFSTDPRYIWATGQTPPDSAPFDDDDFPLPEPLPPIVDPDLPVLPTPPSPPPIPDIAIDPVTEWTRYYVPIDRFYVPLWTYAIPTLTLLTKTEDVRQVRVRFHPNPFGWEPEEVDPTSFCGEFLLSYLPENSSLTVSGVSEEVWASVAGGEPQPANHLIYGAGGGPMEWPELTCNTEYVMTIDIPLTEDIDNLTIELNVNYQE